MSKWETKEFNAEIVAIKFDTDLKKKDGGTYPGTEIIYEAFNQVNKKGIHTKVLKPELRAQLETLNSGDEVTVKFYRAVGDKFWNVSSIEKGHSAKRPQQSSQPSQGGFKGNSEGPNPAAVGQALNLAIELGLASNYEDLLNPAIAAKAIESYKKAKALYADMWNKEVEVKTVKQEQQIEEEDAPF